jgi:hypothetical protein
MPTTPVVPVTWVRSEGEIDAFRRDVIEEGGHVHGEPDVFQPPAGELDDYRDTNFDPLTVLATTVSVSFLLKTLSNIWLEHKHTGGLIVDARGGTLVTRPAPHLAFNNMVLLTDTGVQKWTPSQKNDALEGVRMVIDKLKIADG